MKKWRRVKGLGKRLESPFLNVTMPKRQKSKLYRREKARKRRLKARHSKSITISKTSTQTARMLPREPCQVTPIELQSSPKNTTSCHTDRAIKRTTRTTGTHGQLLDAPSTGTISPNCNMFSTPPPPGPSRVDLLRRKVQHLERQNHRLQGQLYHVRDEAEKKIRSIKEHYKRMYSGNSRASRMFLNSVCKNSN